MQKLTLGAVALLLGGAALAQDSASFKLTEYAFNAGGVPAEGAVAGSASFQITFAGTGESSAEITLGSPSFTMAAGFGSSYPPPGEVAGLLFNDPQTLGWDPEPSVGVYNMYRDLLSNLLTLGHGTCLQQDLDNATATDPGLPPVNDGYFYLVTAENQLSEEGTKGFASTGTERANPAPCP